MANSTTSKASANKLAKTVAATLAAFSGLFKAVYDYRGAPYAPLVDAIANLGGRPNKNGMAYVVGVALRATFGSHVAANAHWRRFVGVTGMLQKGDGVVSEATAIADKDGNYKAKTGHCYTQDKHAHATQLVACNVTPGKYRGAIAWASKALADKATCQALVDAVNGRAMQLGELTPDDVANGKGCTVAKLAKAGKAWQKANA